jgi:hypothetical protein
MLKKRAPFITAVTGPLAVVRKAMQAYVDKDREAIESVIAANYRFTSPLDNAIDRATYFLRCWPNSETITAMKYIGGGDAGEWVWVVYEGHTATKGFRNTELHKVRDGKIVETEVYFGWDLPHPAASGKFVKQKGTAGA